ncbi:hypothetical protein [Plantactinospora sp. KLBMP9567]|uniref:hypothetical protein n=1 Tax=Plantactinospora sp. KLBMP9567 TaxID=3085900 RepID=UPI002982972F|nr:hypothetical protein [Plantactinospora sp. KLBMP9567]MDW5330249.1 hypothetical protein [Plantactinospora sp. KLBMP9567]
MSQRQKRMPDLDRVLGRRLTALCAPRGLTEVVLNHSVIGWRSTWDVRGDSGISVGVLLDRLARQSDTSAWDELEDRLVVEGKTGSL